MNTAQLPYTIPAITSEHLWAMSPIIALVVGSFVTLMQASFAKSENSASVFAAFIASVIAAIGLAVGFGFRAGSFLDGTFLSDGLASFGKVSILSVALIVFGCARNSHMGTALFRGEIASLLLMVLAGMLAMVASDDLITLFVSLELASIGLYAIIGYTKPTRKSQEGAIKYFILGSFASAFLLFGFALLFGATGSMRLSEIASQIGKLSDHSWVQIGGLFTVIGLGFKLALAPFHLWAPDAYESAPTPITAFMATTVKIMVLIVVLRLFGTGMEGLYGVWGPTLIFLAILSMIVANIMALVQTSLKRMLAYSSVAHSGYMAVALVAMGGNAGSLPVDAILFYLVSYTIISVGTFVLLMWLETTQVDNIQLDDLAGFAQRYPWTSVALATFMFAFGGMPPTVGFLAKFFVFNAALTQELYALVLIGAVGSTISLYYYLRVIVRMFMTPSATGTPALAPGRSNLVIAVASVTLILTVALGTLAPQPVLNVLKELASNSLTH